MLVLTGLFPPSYEQIWNWGIKWQPIPITFIPQSIDHVSSSRRFLQNLTRIVVDSWISELLLPEFHPGNGQGI